MKIREVKANEWSQVRSRTIKFILKYSQKHITKSAMSWLKSCNASELSVDGNAVIVALEGHQLVGVLAVADYGRKESLVVVHPNFRKKHIGSQMVDAVVHKMKKIYGRVAVDNLPSLKMCFHSGLVAFDALRGPTGKITLLVGAGQWKREDVQ